MLQKNRFPSILLLSAVTLLSAALWGCKPESRPQISPPPPPPPPPVAGLPAEAPEPELLDAARHHMAGRTEVCGPYLLITNVQKPRLLAACGRLASQLDTVYTKRYGIEPIGKPRGAILLFSKMKTYREFAQAQGLSAGYAGFSLGSRGVVLLHAEVEPMKALLNTLAHELTHLVNRRALGGNVPAWLSEGLASEIGLSAGENGFRELSHRAGEGTRVQRLREAYTDGRAGDLRRLLSLNYREFDREAVSFDYEQSSLFVRFLLADKTRAPKFRAFLKELASSPEHTPESFLQTLGTSWVALENNFEQWLLNS